MSSVTDSVEKIRALFRKLDDLAEDEREQELQRIESEAATAAEEAANMSEEELREELRKDGFDIDAGVEDLRGRVLEMIKEAKGQS